MKPIQVGIVARAHWPPRNPELIDRQLREDEEEDKTGEDQGKMTYSRHRRLGQN